MCFPSPATSNWQYISAGERLVPSLFAAVMDLHRTRVAAVGDSFVANDFGFGNPRHAVPKDKTMLHFFSTDDDILKAGPPPMVEGFRASGLRVR